MGEGILLRHSIRLVKDFCISQHKTREGFFCLFQRKIREEWEEREQKDREEQEKREKAETERREKQVNWVTLFPWRQMMRYPVITCCRVLFWPTLLICFVLMLLKQIRN